MQSIFWRVVKRCTSALSDATEQPAGEPSLIMTSTLTRQFEARAAFAACHIAAESLLASTGSRSWTAGRAAESLRQVQRQQAKLEDIVAKFAEAEREAAASPLSNAVAEMGTILDTLVALDEPEQVAAFLRLRAVLRRVIQSTRLLVVPRGRDRVPAFQVDFKSGKQQTFLLFHHPPEGEQGESDGRQSIGGHLGRC